ncbi:MAG: ABC transporter permease [Chloroflexi bacterium]|nr:ABC transporter permease [Chloroflexota bacterium]
MNRYILNRLVITFPILLLISILDFLFINLAPGDPVQALIDPNRTPVGTLAYEQRMRQLGLDQPIPVRYVKWLGELLQGNLGYSLISRRPVATIISERIWNTFKLTLSALLLSWIIAVPLGALGAVKQYSWLDYLQMTLSFLYISIPTFFIGMLAIYIFGLKLNWLPTGGIRTLGEAPSLVDELRHIVLPTFVLAIGGAAYLTRYARASMLEVIHQEYIQTARAKGLGERSILFSHALRNALLPLITLAGLELPSLFGGAIIIETIFTWPGMGRLGVEAAFKRDYTTMMGLLLITAILVLLGNLLADIAYAWADPRIRFDRGSEQ